MPILELTIINLHTKLNCLSSPIPKTGYGPQNLKRSHDVDLCLFRGGLSSVGQTCYSQPMCQLVFIFSHYKDRKGDAKCRKCGGLA